MMTRLAILALCATLTGPAMAADTDQPAPTQETPAAAPAPSSGKVILDILTVSGMRKALEKMPASFVEGMHNGLEKAQSESGKRLPAGLQEAMENSARESFTSDGFTGRVLRAMKKDYNEQSYQELLADLSTPLARHMAELESNGVPSQQQLADFKAQLAANPLTPQRTDLLHRLDAASRTSDMMSTIILNTSKGLMRGMAGARENCATEAQLKKAEADMEAKINAGKANLADISTNLLAYTYRDVNDADLAEYVGIYEKQNSRHVHDVIYGAVVEEFNLAGARMGRNIMKAVQDKKMACKDGGAKNVARAPTQASPDAGQAGSAVPPATAASEPQSNPSGAKSSIPLNKRKGGDVTRCLEAGSKSDKDIAACAEKYRH